MSPNARGALLMTGSMAAFTLNDTCVKALGRDLPLFQILTLRGALTTLLVFVLARRLGALRLRLPRADRGLVALRAGAEVGATAFFLSALMNMPLANVTAVLQILPLSVTLGAALVFGEAVGWRRMLAIAAGFAGMLLIVRPGPEGFGADSLYALAAVGCVTVRDLATRRMSAAVPSMTVTLISALSVTLFSAAVSAGTGWQAVGGGDAALILAAAVLILAGYILSVQVMRVGEVSFTALFRYSGLLWALVLGWLVFSDWPDALTLAGAGIVVASGVFTLYRERAARRRARD